MAVLVRRVGHVAGCPSIRGCVSQGGTEDDAVATFYGAILNCFGARVAQELLLTIGIHECQLLPLLDGLCALAAHGRRALLGHLDFPEF